MLKLWTDIFTHFCIKLEGSEKEEIFTSKVSDTRLQILYNDSHPSGIIM